MLSIVKEKLGEDHEVRAWNLRPLDTCMKADQAGLTLSTKACESVCYASRRNERSERVQDRAKTNFVIAQRSDFAELMIGAIYDSGIKDFRIHSYGDFFSESYFAAWNRIVSTCSSISFWCYTRAWRQPKFVPLLLDFARKHPANLIVSFSVDQCSWDVPQQLLDLPNTRVAGLLLHDDDHLNIACDFYFRAAQNRTTVPLKVFDNAPVCPHQSGEPLTQKNDRCVRCRICLPRNIR